ncbi:DEAD/DEAH box helicase [Candidatus Omnitrophota bacterium]
MELKEYQKKTLKEIRAYLEWLLKAKDEASRRAKSLSSEFSEETFDFPKVAWRKISNRAYSSKKNGLGEDFPNFYLKLPTGGGKTLLACHAIDLINRTYLKKRTGIILWIVPTTQIYRQTLDHLRNREHPYRQVLDVSSGGRTIIVEKTDRFTRVDVEENLVVMLLMLPSASRQNKETLKLFKDAGGFAGFFPPEDDRSANNKLLADFPNLDYFGKEDEFFGRVPKTSLGNTLRILKSVVIIDEGHKAYSEIAQKTIRNFNPTIVVELSATPPQGGNILVNVSGRELNQEEMIKLDLHITNKATLDWKDVMRSALEKRMLLSKKAKEYESNTGEHIRPICLIQVERTGKDQVGRRFIHVEDVKEYLIKNCGVSEKEIAVKSSEKDDIEGIDLQDKDCGINYIITKQALQEGWDCAFAYILAILTNPGSQLSITQLVGRILRQPKARKTKIKELDESYVYCFRQKAKELLENVKSGFEAEGLGDLLTRVSIDIEGGQEKTVKERTIKYRKKFKMFAGKIYLPKFVIQKKKRWRDISYEMDILSRVDFRKIDLTPLSKIDLLDMKTREEELIYGLSDDIKELLKEKGRISKKGGLELDAVFMTRQILDIVPNSWVAYEISKKVIQSSLRRYDKKRVTNNLIFIIEELRKHLERERDIASEKIFRELMEKKILWFFLLSDKSGYKLPSTRAVKSTSKSLIREDNTPLERSLFEFMPQENFNDMERSVAIYLDEQEKLLWWYRNLSRQDYCVQGWKKNKVYPDFIFSDASQKTQRL